MSYKDVRSVVNLHAKTVRKYRNNVGGTGKILIKYRHTFGIWFNSSNTEDVTATNRYNEFVLGSTSYPFASWKDY
jgi:hypothetical protein